MKKQSCRMIETITPTSRAGGTGFERTEIQNRKIVGTIRNVGRGGCCAGCCALYFYGNNFSCVLQ